MASKKSEIISALTSARAAATFDRADFGYGQDTPAIREATRIYRESWIIPPIDHALRLLEPGKDGTRCEHCGKVH